uniref:Novel protein (Zgc:153679) putative n=1 Tax=Albugo laibachii Nc14 TaxID=890382 RepID=F0W715_9STRA|nr:novel protein (zgc:153679) putative [Albugo laibachii Nc14]|eukprot:CCA16910.1 novel protein (zgc:153679) putative [Albugo laibachii Nc14]
MVRLGGIAALQWYSEGLRKYGSTGYERSKRHWKDPSIASKNDLSGRHYIVTGANSGIGYAIAFELAKRMATVHMLCRNLQRAEKARTEIIEQIKSEAFEPSVEIHIADMSDTESIRSFAASFSSKHTKLDGLINNAGALFQEESRTLDGMEKTMAIALGGSFLLTALMLPLLKEAPSGRVVNISSGGQYLVKLDAEDGKGITRTGASYDGNIAYSLAKRAQVELTRKWVKVAGHTGVLFYSMHPGWSTTPGVTSSLPTFEKLHRNMMRDQSQGADTAVWLAISDEPKENENGTFWLDRNIIKTDFPLASTWCTEQERDQFWKCCQEIYNWKGE